MQKWAPAVAMFLFWMCAEIVSAQHHTVRFFSQFGRPLVVNDLAFSPDGRMVALSTQDGKTSVVSTDSGEILLQHKLAPFSLAFTPDSGGLFMIAQWGTELLDLSSRQVGKIAWQVPQGKLGIGLESRSGKLLLSDLTLGGPA